MSELKNRVNALQAFHNDEDGLEAIQVVMIVAIASVVLIALLKFWEDVKSFVQAVWADLGSGADKGKKW
jgi:Flp pilus assembly pilin Flp